MNKLLNCGAVLQALVFVVKTLQALKLGRMCGSPGVTKSKILNVCMLWSIFMLFSSFLLQNIYQNCIPASWCLLLAAVCVACFISWRGLVNTTQEGEYFVVFCGNLLLFNSYITDCRLGFFFFVRSVQERATQGCRNCQA